MKNVGKKEATVPEDSTQSVPGLSDAEVIALRDSLREKHTQRCIRSDCSVCIVDERTPIEVLANTMGYPPNVYPVDLIEILIKSGKTVEELLLLDADELAAIFDSATTCTIPVGITGSETVEKFYLPGSPSTHLVVNNLLSSQQTRVVKAWRPLTPSEKTARREANKEKEARRQAAKDLAKLQRLERRLEAAQRELDSQRQEVEGKGRGL